MDTADTSSSNPTEVPITPLKQIPLILWLFLVTNPKLLYQLEGAPTTVVFDDNPEATKPPSGSNQAGLRELAMRLKTDPQKIIDLFHDAYIVLNPSVQSSFHIVAAQFQTYMASAPYDPMECGVAGIKGLIP